jgi:ubiquitin-conjugating enzyme E2 J1
MSHSSSSINDSIGVSPTTLRRIQRELSEIQSNPSKHWVCESVNDNLLEWHFTLRGPPGTEFEGGLYHGRILLPQKYPFAPPSIMLLNPNGRFETNKKICLSISNHHPETWQPAWGIRTIMEALRSFFPTPGDGAIGALDYPPDLRMKLAGESGEWGCEICGRKNSEILPKLEEEEEATTETFLPELPKEVIASPVVLSPKTTQETSPAAESPESAHVTAISSTKWIDIGIVTVLVMIFAMVIDLVVHPIQFISN